MGEDDHYMRNGYFESVRDSSPDTADAQDEHTYVVNAQDRRPDTGGLEDASHGGERVQYSIRRDGPPVTGEIHPHRRGNVDVRETGSRHATYSTPTFLSGDTYLRHVFVLGRS